MANTIKHKRSSTPSASPTTTDLELGEIAINTYDGKIFLKKDDGSESIVELGAAGAGGATTLGGLTDVTITSATTNDILQYNGSSWVNSALPAGGFSPSGSVIAFAGSSAPSGWLLCDGSAVSRSTYADLFGVISTTYGVGDGSTTFNLPDLRRRTPIGVGDDDAVGESDALAYTSRSATLTHSIPAHSHDLSNHTHSVPAHYHGAGTLATASNGDHAHSIEHNHAAFTSGGSGTLTTTSDSHDHTFSGTTGNTASTNLPGRGNSAPGNTNKVLRANTSGGDNNTFNSHFNHSHSFSGTTTTDTHNHTISSHTHSIDVPNYTGNSGNGGSHTHTISGNVGATGSGTSGDSAMTSGTPSTNSTGNSSVLTSGDGQYLYMSYIIKT